MNRGAFVAILMVGLGHLVTENAASQTNDWFSRGAEFSRDGKFPEAVEAYALAAKSHPASGTFLNLGLAEWQRGHAGAAILAWEQALWINPFNSPAKANLQFARQTVQVDTPPLKWYEEVSTWLPASAWAWLAAGTFWFAVGLLLLPGIVWRRKRGWQQSLAAITFGLFLVALSANFGVASRSHIGFVLKKNAALQLTPTRDGEVIATLAAGEPARLLKRRGDFVFIRTLGTAGWISRSNFGLICPR